MAKSKQMTDDQLATLVNAEITSAKKYDQSDLSKDRADALKYYRGDADIIEYEEGRSKAVSTDLSDHMGWLLPSLMRVFASSEIIADFQPVTQEDAQALEGATDYINMKFLRECEGYNILHNGFKEGFLFGNGVVKFWWDNSTEYVVKSYAGLSELEWLMLAQDDNVSVTEHTENREVVVDELGQEQEVITHDARLKIKRKTGKLMIAGEPPENFLINKDAKSIKDADFLASWYKATRSELIAQGYPKDKVMNAGDEGEYDSTPEAIERNENESLVDDDTKDKMMERIEVFECYIKTDYDGDDWAEWRRIVMAGDTGTKRNMLYNEPWDDEPCFVDFVPDPDPHRWRGISLYDELKPIQDVKTVLLRQTLDNLYMVNNPLRAVNERNIANMDAVVNPEIGGLVITKGPVGDAIVDIPVPFVAQQSFGMLEYMDAVAEKRTGVSRQSMALDPEALSNQTAAGVQAGQAASFAKTELYARNLAENGLKTLFLSLYKLVKKNQDKPESFNVNGKWIEVDPSQWPDDVEVSVNVGLGSGSKDRDMSMLSSIKQAQEQILMQLGPSNPLVSLKEYSHTLHKMVETAGIKNPEAFFKEVTPESLKAMQAQNKDKPDPKVIEAQQKLQLEGQKAQEQASLAREKAKTELQLMREKNAAQIEMEREKHQMEMGLRKEEMQLEAQLTAQANILKAQSNQQPDTNLDRP